MPKIRVWLSLSVILFAACQPEPRAPKPPEFNEAFSGLLLPPKPEFVSRAGGADALQITVRTPIAMAEVADYYRALLTQGDWRLVSDIKNADGSTALYAEHNGPPLWVRIWKPIDHPGTMVQLTGAVVRQDSVKSGNRRDTTAKRTS